MAYPHSSSVKWVCTLNRQSPVFKGQTSVLASLVALMVKNLPALLETQVWSQGQKDPLEKGTATHSSILACRIAWMEEPGGLQSIGSQREGHDWVTNTSPLFQTRVKDHRFMSLSVGTLVWYALAWTQNHENPTPLPWSLNSAGVLRYPHQLIRRNC